MRLRLNDPAVSSSKIHDKLLFPMRCVVHSPMQYRALFLVGDAAHLVAPTGAKGMNLALYDADVLAQALVTAVQKGDSSDLEGYSSECLPRIWRYQEYSVWMTDTMHDAGDPTLHGSYRQMVARSRLDTLFASATAGSLHSQYMRGQV